MQESVESRRNYFFDLPSDIIEIIFSDCLPTTSSDQWITLNPQWAPILFMHVCSSWRRLALDCSALWRNVSFQHLVHHGRHDPSLAQFATVQSQIMEQINLWRTARKGSRISLSVVLESPISLYFIIRRSDSPPFLTLKWSEHIKATIVDYIEIIHKLRIDFQFMDSSAFLSVPTDRMHNLECLELTNLSLDTFYAADNIRKVPSLRRLKMTVLHVHDGMSSFSYWPQLTHLILTRHVCAPIRSILNNCPNLQQLSTVVENNITLQDSVAIITAHHLTYLSITFNCHSNPSFFRDIYFPALTSLRIHCGLGNRFASFAWNIFDQSFHDVQFFSQLHQLQTLILAYSDMDGDALLELLRLTPKLLRLVIDSDLKTYRSFLTNLVYNPDEARIQLIPMLEDLTICIDTCYASRRLEFEEEVKDIGLALVQMAISRAVSTSPGGGIGHLRKVLLCYEEYQHFTEIIGTSLPMSPATMAALGGLECKVRRFGGGQRYRWAEDEINFW